MKLNITQQKKQKRDGACSINADAKMNAWINKKL